MILMIVIYDYLRVMKAIRLVKTATGVPCLILHMGLLREAFLAFFYFLFFINDLPSEIPNFIVDIYADDTTFS